MRRAAKVDANQADIVYALRRCGFHVLHLHRLGQGVPDILVTGHNLQSGKAEALLVEIKQRTGDLTDDERAWHTEYPADGPLIVARSADDVLQWFGRA